MRSIFVDDTPQCARLFEWTAAFYSHSRGSACREWLKSIKDERVRKIAEAGVHIAEQEAEKRMKSGDTKLSGENKKQIAITSTMQLAQKAGLKVDREVIEPLIEAVLGAVVLKNGKAKTETN